MPCTCTSSVHRSMDGIHTCTIHYKLMHARLDTTRILKSFGRERERKVYLSISNTITCQGKHGLKRGKHTTQTVVFIPKDQRRMLSRLSRSRRRGGALVDVPVCWE